MTSGLSEADIQIQLVDYLKIRQEKDGFLFFAIPNEVMGQARTKGGIGRMARFKRMGLRHGVADLTLVKDGKAYFLEMKKKGGKQSDNQKTFEIDAKKVHAPYSLAYSFDEAVLILKRWKIIT